MTQISHSWAFTTKKYTIDVYAKTSTQMANAASIIEPSVCLESSGFPHISFPLKNRKVHGIKIGHF